MANIIASDLPLTTALLADVSNNIEQMNVTVNNIIQKIKDQPLNSDKGFDLLDMKNQMFVNYLFNLAYTVMRKLHGLKLEEDPSIERLVEMRVTIERLRPMEDKLKYQLEKYRKMSKEGTVNQDEPSRLKGSLDNIEGSFSDEDDDDEDNKNKTKKDDSDDKLYRIPKIMQTHYPDEETSADKKGERERKRALNSSMMREAIMEHTDDPTVVYDTDVLKQRAIKKRKEIETYEENYMTRINLSKKARSELREITTLGTMKKDLLSFHNMSSLDGGGGGGGNSDPSHKKFRSSASGGSGGGGRGGYKGNGKQKGKGNKSFKRKR